MSKKLKVITRGDLREAVDSIAGNVSAKKYLSKFIDDIEENGEATIEHGDIKAGVAFLDYSEEDETEDEEEDQEEDEEDEDQEDQEDEA